MKKVSIKYKIIGAYISILLFCAIIANLNYSVLYNKVTIIQDKEEVIKKINMSIPVKIQITNEKLGNYTLEDEESIKTIWNSINEITADSSEQENYVNRLTEIKIKGSVYYLNGMKDDFEISDVLRLNNHIYYDSYKLPMISSLRNNLLGYLYCPYNIGQFMSSRNRVILISSNKNSKNLGNDDKENIKNIISKSIKVKSDKEIMALTANKEEVLAHIKVYIDEEDNNTLKAKSYNVVNIDVYDDFFVVQYMGDENGRHIYMKGNLKDACRKINNNSAS